MTEKHLEIIEETLKDKTKENRKLKKENDELKKAPKSPYTEASMTIEYMIDDSKKITLGATSKIVDSLDNTHELLYFNLLGSLRNIIILTTGKEETEE